MKTHLKALLPTLFCFILLMPASAEAAQKTFFIHETEIFLPHVVGLDDELMEIDIFAEYMAAMCPTVNFFHWGYISLEDEKRIRAGIDEGLKTYVLIESAKATEKQQYSTSDFAELRQYFRKKHKTLVDLSDPQLQRAQDEVSQQMSKITEQNIEIGQQSVESLGVILEEKHYIAIGLIMVTKGSVGGTVKQTKQIGILNNVLVANKIVFVYVYCDYEDGAGIPKALSISKEIVEKMIKDNPSRD